MINKSEHDPSSESQDPQGTIPWDEIEDTFAKIFDDQSLTEADVATWSAFTSAAREIITEEDERNPFTPEEEQRLWQEVIDGEVGPTAPSANVVALDTAVSTTTSQSTVRPPWRALAAGFLVGLATLFVFSKLDLQRGGTNEIAQLSPTELNYGKSDEWTKLDGIYVGLIRDRGGKRTVQGTLLPCTKEQLVRKNEWHLLNNKSIEGLEFRRRSGDQVELIVLGYRNKNASLIGLDQDADAAIVVDKIGKLIEEGGQAAVADLQTQVLGGRFGLHFDPTDSRTAMTPLTAGASVSGTQESIQLRIDKFARNVEGGDVVGWLTMSVPWIRLQ